MKERERLSGEREERMKNEEQQSEVENTPQKKVSSTKKPVASSSRKSIRISELQKSFNGSMLSTTTPVTKEKKEIRRESSRKLKKHYETIQWINENVVAYKDF